MNKTKIKEGEKTFKVKKYSILKLKKPRVNEKLISG